MGRTVVLFVCAIVAATTTADFCALESDVSSPLILHQTSSGTDTKFAAHHTIPPALGVRRTVLATAIRAGVVPSTFGEVIRVVHKPMEVR